MTKLDKNNTNNKLEEQILSQAKSAVSKSINKELTGYNKPLTNLTEKVIDKHKDELFGIFDRAFSKVISNESFEKEVHSAFNHKIARVLVSQLEGSVDKAVNAIKNNPKMKARMILAIEEIIESPK